MSKLEAQQQAIELARQKLAGLDISQRCANLGLPFPQGGVLKIRAFGKDFVLQLPVFELQTAGSCTKPGDMIIVLHYLLCEQAIKPSDELITFRQLPGGQFYLEPFLSRTVKPLVKRIGNNIDLLKRNLGRFDHELIPGGDLAARIHVIGHIFVDLVYHCGDEEFGPGAEVLFDSAVKHVYNTEDAAYIASCICLGLL